MRSSFSRWIAVIAALIVFGGLLGTAECATPGDDTSPITIEFKDVDVQTALNALFMGRGMSYVVAPDVQGTLSMLSFKGVPFNQALKQILKSAGLVMRVQDGVYNISKKPDVTAYDASAAASTASTDVAVDTTTTAESIIDKIPLSNMGASEILSIMSGNSNSNSSYGGFGGMMGGMGGSMGGYGGSMGGFGGGNYGGSSYGGGSYGGSSYGGSSYGGGRSW